MTTKKKTVKKRPKSGRPVIPIDWIRVESLLQAGCSGCEIAGYLGVHHDTLYDRTLVEQGLIFSEYSAKFKAKGESLLRSKQFESAIKDKNVSMLIWLGKNRLLQSDKTEIDHSNKDGSLTPKYDLSKLSDSAIKELINAGLIAKGKAQD